MRAEYNRDSLVCVVDRSRGFLVVATPEEYVRQDTLDWLIDTLGIPARLVRSEFHTARRGGTGRADILVLAPGSSDHGGTSVLVVECKKPGTFLDDRAQDQATGYAKTCGASYVVLTNGDDQIPFANDNGRWRKLAKVPSWREMLKQSGLRWVDEPVRIRDPWNAIATAAKRRSLIKPGSPYEHILGPDTPGYLAPLALSLFGCLAFESDLNLPIEDEVIAIEKDLGVRARSFGNVAGGTWPSEFYRSLLVRDKVTGSHQVVSLTVLGGAKNVNDPAFGNTRGMTYLVVSVDVGPTSHNSLQLALDKFVSEAEVRSGKVVLRHDGTMTGGKRGRVANHVVTSFVRREAPQLIEDRWVLLGTLPTNRLIHWDDARDFLVRVVRYALVRDQLRAELRAKAPPAPTPPPSPWKHGDIVKALYEGKPHEPARYLRPKGKTWAIVHWYDNTFSALPVSSIMGLSTKPWKLPLEKPNVRFGSSEPIE